MRGETQLARGRPWRAIIVTVLAVAAAGISYAFGHGRKSLLETLLLRGREGVAAGGLADGHEHPRVTQTTLTDAQAARATSWCIHIRRSTSTKTSSVTSSGCTTDIEPLCRASAWNTTEPTGAATPR
jgi:hypothetical protein